jgi:Uma2 family endonuclease
MRALVLDPETSGLEKLLEIRRRSGLDRCDEVWDGVLHMVPAPNYRHASVQAQVIVILSPKARAAGFEVIDQSNLGEGANNYRVPDIAMHRPGTSGTWHSTAPLLVEVVSPRDESWDKLPFYAAHDVDEVLIVDPLERSVDWLALHDGEYRPIERSGLVDLGARELAEQIEWPPTDGQA